MSKEFSPEPTQKRIVIANLDPNFAVDNKQPRETPILIVAPGQSDSNILSGSERRALEKPRSPTWEEIPIFTQSDYAIVVLAIKEYRSRFG